MKKIILLILSLFIFTPAAHAASDLTVSCSSTECTQSNLSPLFNVSNAYPGLQNQKSITFQNNRQNSCVLYFSLLRQNESDLFKYLSLSIKNTAGLVYSGTLQDIFENDDIFLGDLSKNSSTDYSWTLSLNQNTDNNLEKQLSNFNLNFKFNCQEEIITPTPKPGNPAISIISFPETINISNSIPINFSIENAPANTSYFYKVMGERLNGSGLIKTFYNGELLSSTTAWKLHPSFATDSTGKYSGTVFAKADGQLGKYSFYMKIQNQNDQKTLTSNTNNIEINNESNQVLTNNTNSPNTCQDQPPTGAPKLLSAIPGQNSVTLKWAESTGPLTYYLIAFGNSSGNYKYGNPNIGGAGTNSYTVSNLSSNETYYFVVRAGNGCASGFFSNELSVSPFGNVIQANPAGFAENVLGAQDDKTTKPPETVLPQDVGSVAGDTHQNYIWYSFLFLIFIIIIFDIFRKRKSKLIHKH